MSGVGVGVGGEGCVCGVGWCVCYTAAASGSQPGQRPRGPDQLAGAGNGGTQTSGRCCCKHGVRSLTGRQAWAQPPCLALPAAVGSSTPRRQARAVPHARS